jgi:hypothetical protein
MTGSCHRARWEQLTIADRSLACPRTDSDLAVRARAAGVRQCPCGMSGMLERALVGRR